MSDGMTLLPGRTETRAGHTRIIHVSSIQQTLPEATATAPISLVVTPPHVLPKVTRLKSHNDPHVISITISRKR